MRFRHFACVALNLPLLALACAAPPEGAPPDRPQADASALESADWPRLSLTVPLPTERPLRAAFLLVDGIYNTELVAPLDILDHVKYQRQPGIEVFTVSADGESITTAEGLVIAADHSFASAPAPDILVVASAEHSRDSDLEDSAMIDWVRDRGAQARYVMSLCWGAFVLAESGLLDDRAATTFPRDFETFAERFPEIALRRGPSFVHDGPMITSQGGIRSFDAAMYLIDHLYGPDVARAVGGGLLIDWPPATSALPPEVVGASD